MRYREERASCLACAGKRHITLCNALIANTTFVDEAPNGDVAENAACASRNRLALIKVATLRDSL